MGGVSAFTIIRKKPMGQKLLKGLLADMGWEEADLKRLKLIK
jgi:hypothetical protein